MDSWIKGLIRSFTHPIDPFIQQSNHPLIHYRSVRAARSVRTMELPTVLFGIVTR
jgi:hypothetical protein